MRRYTITGPKGTVVLEDSIVPKSIHYQVRVEPSGALNIWRWELSGEGYPGLGSCVSLASSEWSDLYQEPVC